MPLSLDLLTSASKDLRVFRKAALLGSHRNGEDRVSCEQFSSPCCDGVNVVTPATVPIISRGKLNVPSSVRIRSGVSDMGLSWTTVP